MEIPMMQLYEDGPIKLHRLDVALELFARLKAVKRMSPKDKIIFLEEIRYHLGSTKFDIWSSINDFRETMADSFDDETVS
jgi:hypothetical protein